MDKWLARRQVAGLHEVPCSWERVVVRGCGDAGLWWVCDGAMVCPCAAVVLAVVCF